MPNSLDLPDELLSLIEKREHGDRRDSSDATNGPPDAKPAADERRQGVRRADDRGDD